MSNTYLPADVRTRIVDLMKANKVTQKKLALAIDVHESTLSRFLSGTTEIPDKKNYDIAELELSVEAAKNLYTGKVKPDVVNRLLESPRFATVTYMIAQYLDDTTAAGFAAQNQMLASISSMLLAESKTPAAVQAAREANTGYYICHTYPLKCKTAAIFTPTKDGSCSGFFIFKQLDS